MKFKRSKLGVVAFLAVFFTAGFSYALNVIIEPAKAQRAVDGFVRVHIYADNAVNLISFGVKVVFNPVVLEVVEAQKYTVFSATASGWVMDADGDYATDVDRYTTPVPVIDPAGSVTMIGGRLIGSSTTGLSGKVLLGYIKFKAKAIGNSNLAVSVAKAPPFDNFVGPGTPPIVYDGDVAPVTAPVNKGLICVVDIPCEGDLDGNGGVDGVDFNIFKAAFGSAYPGATYKPAADLDGNGGVDGVDFNTFKADFGRGTCPSCQ